MKGGSAVAAAQVPYGNAPRSVSMAVCGRTIKFSNPQSVQVQFSMVEANGAVAFSCPISDPFETIVVPDNIAAGMYLCRLAAPHSTQKTMRIMLMN